MTETVTGIDEWTLERFQKGDEGEVLELFKTVFQRSRSLDHWRWQFQENPYGGPFVSLARRRADRALIGSYSVMPVQFNLMGRSVLGCQSVDTAVHPDHRNQRVFEHTARDCYSWCHEKKTLGVIGFPNARSYPGFMRTLGWQRIAFPKRYALRLALGPALSRALALAPLAALMDWGYRSARRLGINSRLSFLRRADGDIRLETSGAVPPDYDQLWALVRSQEVLSIWKDAEYLRWRYDRNPDRRFTYSTLRRAGEPVALAITVDMDDVRYICEFMAHGRDVALGRRLAWEVAAAAAASRIRSLVLIGHDQGFFDEAFEGFRRTTSFDNVFCGRAFESGTLAELLPYGQNWSFTFGDGDFA